MTNFKEYELVIKFNIILGISDRPRAYLDSYTNLIEERLKNINTPYENITGEISEVLDD